MSVRMALAKLAACAAGGAVLGGGAVHVSEAPSTGEIHHVKPIKIKQERVAHYVERRAPRAIHRARRLVKVTTTTTTRSCAAPQQYALAPVPYMPPMPQQPQGGGGGGGVPVVIGGGPVGGFGGGFQPSGLGGQPEMVENVTVNNYYGNDQAGGSVAQAVDYGSGDVDFSTGSDDSWA